MAARRRVHDRAILDALDAIDPQPFEGEVWRIARKDREPLRGSSTHGRWSPNGEFEVLYTSLEREGALAEIGYRLSLEPVWPSRIQHEIHRIAVRTEKTLHLADLEHFQEKWNPVFRPKMRQCKNARAVSVSTKCETALAALQSLGVDTAKYQSFDYEATQAITAAADFLAFDGLLVPSARAPCGNLVIFLDRVTESSRLEVRESMPVDWTAWRKDRKPAS